MRQRKCLLGFFVWRISCFGDGERRSGRQPADQGEFLRRRSGEAEGEFLRAKCDVDCEIVFVNMTDK